MQKLLIISKNPKMLKEAITFNYIKDLHIKECKEVIDRTQLESFGCIITDDELYSEIAKFFTFPVELNSVIEYIESSLNNFHFESKFYVDEKSRIFFFENSKIKLTEQSTHILCFLLSKPKWKANISELLSIPHLKSVSFESLKTSIYRINQRLANHGTEIRIILKNNIILLEKS